MSLWKSTSDFTEIEKTKLAGIETGANADQTNAEILTAVESESGRDMSADGSKLDGIETGATADQTDTEIISAVSPVVNPLALSQGVKMTAADSGSNGIQVANNDDINFGTGDFTLVWVGSLPDYTPESNQFLFRKDDLSVGFTFGVHSTEYLYLYDRMNSSTYSTEKVNLSDNSINTIIITITSETEEENGKISFYVNGEKFGDEVDIDNGDVSNWTSTADLQISGTSAARTSSNTLAAYIYNYALNADQVKDLYYNGVAYEDRDGSMTEIYDSLAGGVNLTESPTGTITVDTADTVNDNRVIFTTTEVASDIANKNVSITFDCSVGGQYLLYLDDSWETSLDARDLEVGTNTISNLLLPSTGVICIKFITENTVVSNFSIVKAGTTLRLEPENIQLSPGQWLDAANGHHAKLPAEGTSLIRPQKEGFIEWTNTWSASSAGQYVSGINEDIFPSDKIRIEWIRFETETTGVNITLGDQSDTDRYVEATALVEDLDVSSPANRGHDGTNLQLVITPSETYTGSIKTTIKYTLI